MLVRRIAVIAGNIQTKKKRDSFVIIGFHCEVLHTETKHTCLTIGKQDLLTQQLLVWDGLQPLQPAVAHRTVGAVGQPVQRREVDGLGDVEAGVEAGVVCAWERDDKFARHLNRAHHLDACINR